MTILPKRPDLLKWTALATGAALLFFAFRLWMNPQPPPADPSALFDRYFRPAEYQQTQLPPGMVAQTLRQQAFRLYREGRYDQALILFNELLRPGDDPELLFFRANTQLSLGEPAPAVADLNKIPQTHDLFPFAQWYLALALLKNNDAAGARAILRKISRRKDHPESEHAAELVKALR